MIMMQESGVGAAYGKEKDRERERCGGRAMTVREFPKPPSHRAMGWFTSNLQSLFYDSFHKTHAAKTA